MSKKEIYTYEAPWTIYGMNWSIKTNSSDFRLAIGSFVEEYCNKVRVRNVFYCRTLDRVVVPHFHVLF